MQNDPEIVPILMDAYNKLKMHKARQDRDSFMREAGLSVPSNEDAEFSVDIHRIEEVYSLFAKKFPSIGKCLYLINFI